MKKLLLTTLLAGLACTAQATLIVEELFDFSGVPASGATILNDNGYTTNLGNYSVSDGPGVFTGSIASPIGTEVNTLRVGSGNTARHDMTTTQGTVYYFSFLFEYATATQTRVQFNGDGLANPQPGNPGNTNNQSFYAGVTSGNFGLGSNNTTGSATQTAVTADTDYFVIGNFVVENDNAWTINANLYTDGLLVPGSAPVSWDHTYTQNFGPKGIVTAYTFQSQGGNSFFNGLRVGTEYADVIPEPTSAALLVGSFALLALRRRR